jgi:hypothetical protein
VHEDQAPVAITAAAALATPRGSLRMRIRHQSRSSWPRRWPYKHLVVAGAGAGHGWELVAPLPGGAPSRVSRTVLAFLRDVTS